MDRVEASNVVRTSFLNTLRCGTFYRKPETEPEQVSLRESLESEPYLFCFGPGWRAEEGRSLQLKKAGGRKGGAGGKREGKGEEFGNIWNQSV